MEWFGFLQTRRILDTRNQAQVDAKKLAKAILEVVKERGGSMTDGQSRQMAEDLFANNTPSRQGGDVAPPSIFNSVCRITTWKENTRKPTTVSTCVIIT